MSKTSLAFAIIAIFVFIHSSNSQLLNWNYCGGNIWTSDKNSLYDNKPSITSGNIKCGESSCMYGNITGPGIISFAWKKSINMNPAYNVNYSFYIVGAKKALSAKCNDTGWKTVALPIESGTREVIWELTLDSMTPRGRCPNFADGSAWIANVSFSRSSDYYPGEAIPMEESGVDFMPKRGSLSDSFTYNISKDDIPECSELALEIMNPQLDRWEPLGEGKQTLNNITFKVPTLSFIKPTFFGDIEFRFNCGNTIIGPFKGPSINLNLLSIEQDPSTRTLSIVVISNVCACDICLKCDNITRREAYSGCGKPEKLTFRDLNMSASKWDIGVCNE